MFLFFLISFSFYLMPFWIGGKTIITRDIHRYYIPIWDFGVNSLKNGELPFWNPLIMCGAPFLANAQSCLFYPLTLLFHFTGVAEGMGYYIVLHMILTAFFMYLWLRSIQVSMLGSVIGALTFSLNGAMMAMTEFPISLAAVTYFPLVLLCFRHALNQGTLKWILATSIAMLFMYFSGDVSSIYMTTLLLGLITVGKFVEPYWQRRIVSWCTLRRALLVVVIFGGLGSFQMIPFFELTQNTNHSHMVYENVTIWSMPLHHIFAWFIPAFQQIDYSLIPFVEGQRWLESYYLGVVPCLIAGLSLFHFKDRRVQTAILLFCVGLLIVLGRFSLFYRLFYDYAPLAHMVRYPARFFFIIVFAVSTLAGLGFDVMLASHGKTWAKHLPKKLLLLFALIVVILVMGYAQPFFKKNLFLIFDIMTKFTLPELPDDKMYFFLRAIEASFVNLKRSLMLIGVTLIFLVLHLKKRLRPELISGVICALLVFDLYFGSAGDKNIMRVEEFQRQPKSVEFLSQKTGIYRAMVTERLNTQTLGYNRHTYESNVKRGQERLLTNQNMLYGVPMYSGYESIISNLIWNYTNTISSVEGGDPYQSRLYDLINGKYVLQMPDQSDAPEHMQKIFDGEHVEIFENQHVLPRAFLVDQAETIEGELKVFQDTMGKLDFDPESIVYLSFSDEGKRQSTEKAWSTAQAQAVQPKLATSVEFTKVENNALTLNVTTAKARWLFMSETYNSHWRATLDGVPTPIALANIAFRAIPVGPGRHTVHLYYFPSTFYVGLGISVLTLIALVFAFCARRKRF